MADPSSQPISPLRGLLEVTRLLRAQGDLPAALTAIARTIGEALGYGTVAINLYRREWDDFEVAVVHGNERAREALLGRVRSRADWNAILAERFCRRGAYCVPAGAVDWKRLGPSYVPDGPPEATGDPDAWDPEDALFVTLRHQDGHLLGIVSVDEPVSGRKPADNDLDLLVAFTDHAAAVLQSAAETAEAARHRRALEEMLAVSSQLTSGNGADEILGRVCSGIRDALGFQNVSALLVEDDVVRFVPQATVGWQLGDTRLVGAYPLSKIEPLFDPAFEREGCFLLPNDEARRRIDDLGIEAASELNGSGPWAWNRHWLLVPLRDADDALIGLIWADDPSDRLLPSADRLQALRIFANDAAASLASGRQVDQLRFLADHDPLTRLLNRRAFIERLGGEVARATRYGRSFGLIIADLDGFKQLNDRYGHATGDEALQLFAAVVSMTLRRPDEAYRIGGDEFAVLLAEASERDARTVVSRIRGHLAEMVDDPFRTLTASFGCAACPDDAGDATALFRLADAALYEAKRSGAGLTFVSNA